MSPELVTTVSSTVATVASLWRWRYGWRSLYRRFRRQRRTVPRFQGPLPGTY